MSRSHINNYLGRGVNVNRPIRATSNLDDLVPNDTRQRKQPKRIVNPCAGSKRMVTWRAVEGGCAQLRALCPVCRVVRHVLYYGDQYRMAAHEAKRETASRTAFPESEEG